MRRSVFIFIAALWLCSATGLAANFIELRDRPFYGTQYRINAQGNWRSIGFLGHDLEVEIQQTSPELKTEFDKARPLGIISTASFGVALYGTAMNLLLTGNDWSLVLIALSIGIPSNMFYRYRIGDAVADYNSAELSSDLRSKGVRFASQISF